MKVYVMTEEELKNLITQACNDGHFDSMQPAECIKKRMPTKDVSQMKVSEFITKLTFRELGM